MFFKKFKKDKEKSTFEDENRDTLKKRIEQELLKFEPQNFHITFSNGLTAFIRADFQVLFNGKRELYYTFYITVKNSIGENITADVFSSISSVDKDYISDMVSYRLGRVSCRSDYLPKQLEYIRDFKF